MKTQELTTDEQAHFRQMVRECEERHGWSVADITRALGYVRPGPVYGYLKPNGGGPSRARYDDMVLLHARLCSAGQGRGYAAEGTGTLEGLAVLAEHVMHGARIAEALQKRPMTVAKLDAVLANLHIHLRADAELLMGLVE